MNVHPDYEKHEYFWIGVSFGVLIAIFVHRLIA